MPLTERQLPVTSGENYLRAKQLLPMSNYITMIIPRKTVCAEPVHTECMVTLSVQQVLTIIIRTIEQFPSCSLFKREE